MYVTFFYCAGLRARMGAGFSRMNDLTIIQTTQVRSHTNFRLVAIMKLTYLKVFR